MSTQYVTRLKKRLRDCARQHYLQLPWSMNLNAVELSMLFNTLEQSAACASTNTRRITIGHKVTLFDVQEKEIITLMLTNPRDSNPDKGFVSCFSPLGRQLIGRMPGDVIDIKIFCRSVTFRVVRIENQSAC